MSATRAGYMQVDQVWKRFKRGQLHDSLRDLVPSLSRRLLRSTSNDALREGEFWAVKDLSFEIKPGEALGIIGANGAGKSTTLKLLTRILRPTYGRVEVRGRVGALIEVSAGFHGDLTGRENVFLQGSIMGMAIEMIRRRFDEIVEFSGVGEFLDTPVKRYSSGMSARLGFAIAAHLDPDVLIIDEVLAVGDYRYQNKAFGRIRQLVTSGIPVVIVSHQLDRIASLCTNAIVLERGTVAFRGSAADSIAWYLSGNRMVAEGGTNGSAVRFQGLRVEVDGPIPSGQTIHMTLDGAVESLPLMAQETIQLRVRSAANGQVAFSTTLERCDVELAREGPFRLRISLDMNLRPGVFALEPVLVMRDSGKEVVNGPVAYIQIADDPGFVGTTHLKPRMSLTDGS